MVALTPSGIGRHWGATSRSTAAIVATLATGVLVLALAWSFAAAGGLRPAAHTESTCEQLWSEGRYTADLADADHDAFVAACLGR
jgi:hypothetical protein